MFSVLRFMKYFVHGLVVPWKCSKQNAVDSHVQGGIETSLDHIFFSRDYFFLFLTICIFFSFVQDTSVREHYLKFFLK